MSQQPDRPRGTWIAWLVLAAWLMGYRGCYIGLDRHDLEPPKDAPDLVQAFAQSDDPQQAKADALVLAALCRSIADVIEYDGQLDEPRLRTGQQLDRLRRWTREYTLDGVSLGTRYPALPPAVKKYLDDRLGTEAGPLTSQQRTKWVVAYRKIAEAAEYAAARGGRG